MFEKRKTDRRTAALQKEWNLVTAQEDKMLLAAKHKAEQAAGNADAKKKLSDWKTTLESKIPAKVYDNLRAAFGKAFSLIFEKGEVIIEKTYNKDAILKDFAVRDYAVEIKGSRKELKAVRQKSGAADFANAAVSTVEGIGLGILGIGLPDIVIFIGILLKGIYEAALNYGFDYDDPKEKLLILKMMETALLEGEDWIQANDEVDQWIQDGITPQATPHSTTSSHQYHGCSEEVRITLAIQEQIRKTADVFALDMLLLKFIQGTPIIGIVGGAANPVYYNKIMKYVKLKYQKRYLTAKMASKNDGTTTKTRQL